MKPLNKKRRDRTFAIQRKPKEITFSGARGTECLLTSSMDGRPRLIIYHCNRIVFTQRFTDELNARRFAVEEYRPPAEPTKRHRQKREVEHEG